MSLARVHAVSLPAIGQMIADYVRRHDLDALRELRAKAKAADVWIREQAGDLDAAIDGQLHLAEAAVRIELAIGEVLTQTPTRQGDPKSARVAESVKLSDIGVTHKQSSRWKRAAKVPADVRERFLEVARERRETPSTSALVALGKLDHAQAAAAIERFARGEVKELRSAIDAARHEARHARAGELAQRSTPLDPAELGRFGLILADPPWKYSGSTTTPGRRIEQHYPTMTLEEVCELRVQELALDDCVLGLWVPEPLLISHAPSVIEAWGFAHRSGWVWCKDGAPGMGHWSRVDHEHLLLCVRGNPPTPIPAMRPSSLLRAPKGAHSEKPVEAHQRLERMFPGVRRLEMFARAPRDGWRAWGNQAA